MTDKNQKNSTTLGFIEETVSVAEDVKIYPNVYLLGNTVIGKGTIIYPNTTIENSVIGENCVIKSSFIEDSVVKDNVKIGPFAHLRPQSIVENDCKLFVVIVLASYRPAVVCELCHRFVNTAH